MKLSPRKRTFSQRLPSISKQTTCFSYGKIGHMARDCVNKRFDGPAKKKNNKKPNMPPDIVKSPVIISPAVPPRKQK
jgi:hypothetical protein